MEMNGGKFPVCKIQRLDDGSLLGGAGDLPRAYEIVNWCIKGRKPGKLAAPIGDTYARILFIDPDGTALIYANNEFPIRILRSYAAIGSGQDYAITSMHLGKTSAEAVAIASELCSSVGMGIDTLEL